MNKTYLFALAAMGVALAAPAQKPIDQASRPPLLDDSAHIELKSETHSAALYEGKTSTGGHAAIHREDATSTNYPSVGLSALWQSKYATQGRDNLERGGIYPVEAVLEWHGLSGGTWVAVGDTEAYTEVDLFVEYALEAGPLDFSLGYARLEFIEDHTGDNEVAAGTALNAIPYLIPGVSYVYSTEAEGGFLEVTLKSEFAVFEERLVFEPYVLQGFDSGYVSADYDGPNNFEVGIGATLALLDGLDLVGSISHSWAQDNLERDGLGDLSWVVIGMAGSF